MDNHDVENGIQEIVYQSFQESDNYKISGMILGMYRICGVATFLIGMIASIQDKDDYKNYSPLKAINIYSVFLPLFVMAYDSQIPKLLGREEHKIPKVAKYTYVSVYWTLMLLVIIFYLNDPKMDVWVQ